MRWLVAFAVAFFMAASSVKADDHCLMAEAHVEFLFDIIPLAYRVETIEGDELTVFLAAFNATEPVTDYVADKLVVLGAVVHPLHYRAVLVYRGCVVKDGLMLIETFKKYKKGIPLGSNAGRPSRGTAGICKQYQAAWLSPCRREWEI